MICYTTKCEADWNWCGVLDQFKFLKGQVLKDT